jgi:Asp/Glu/hydantoin racemase
MQINNMPHRIAFIHTVSSLPPVFKGLCTELIPEADAFHVVDESLLQDTIRSGEITKATARRLLGHLISTQEAGAEMAMVTCSSIGPAVDWSRCFVDIPVYRVDESMAELAVRTGKRIGVAATLRTTLDPTLTLVREKAASLGTVIQIIPKLCAGAFEAITGGDTTRHDAIVRDCLQELIGQSDVIVLAQASMARVVDSIPGAERPIPILSSPRLAVKLLASSLAS